jgi:FMN phosphatase YigB (HAD superfamily)
MPLSLEQYIRYLDTRDIPWPTPPEIERPKAKPYLVRLPTIRAVTWNVYGTLLAIAGGELYLEHPQAFIMDVALDKTIQEFKMWGSMTRKPGQPAEYLRQIYSDLLAQQQLAVPDRAEKYPEVAVDKLWETFIKRLFQKDYQFDAGFFGSLNEFSRKVAYFFHASLQGVSCYPGALAALRQVVDIGLNQGLLGNGQCFTPGQLEHCLSGDACPTPDARHPTLDELVDPSLRFLSYEIRARQPSDRLVRQALAALAGKGIKPDEVLHVGSRVALDVVPARRLGMRTALFAGDKASLQATPEQLKESASRPDVLLTELTQIGEVVCPPNRTATLSNWT